MIALLGVVTTAAVVMAVLLYRELTAGLPEVARLLDYRPPVATRVLAADGTLLAELYLEKRYLVPIYKLPSVVRLAFLAAEDAQFYDHRGIAPSGILRAVLENYRAGSTRQGGSTITQQVVKQLLLTPERSYERKVKELVLALRLEHELTKDEILYLYLNQIYLGDGAYGIQAAAQEYFGKDAADLTLADAALLAGLPQAPSRYSPTKNPKLARSRQRYVLRRMVEEGFVSTEEAEHAAKQPLGLATRAGAPSGPAPYFVEQVRGILESRYGKAAPYQAGLVVHTTVDLAMQKIADDTLRAGVAAADAQQGFRGPLRKLSAAEKRALVGAEALPDALPEPGTVVEVAVLAGPGGKPSRRDGSMRVRWAGGDATIPPAGLARLTAAGVHPAVGDVYEARLDADARPPSLEILTSNGTQGALLSMETATGDVKAMSGGVDFSRSQFNRVTQAFRQPGSSFKPLVYAAAMDRGFTPATIINDAPVSYRVGNGQWWSPHNFENRYFGPTTLREALTHSRNVVTVKLVSGMGLGYLLDYLPRFGFSRPFPRNLSIALGTSEVTLLEMARAYSVFPNLGRRVEPRFITRITDLQGETIEEFPVSAQRVLAPETAFVTLNLMRSVVEHGTGQRAALGRPVAGKTGTTNDLRDAWFIGFTPELLTGVWIGHDSDRSLGDKQTGGRIAAPIWADFQRQVLDGAPVQDFAVPDSVVLVNVDPRSGLRAGPRIQRTVLEAFKRGTEPSEFAGVESPAKPDDDPADAGGGVARAGGEPDAPGVSLEGF